MIYRIQITDVADAEMDALALWLAGKTSAEHAAHWYDGLIDAIGGLAEQPRLHAVARENDQYGVEVRRLLYRGPGKGRRSGTPYRVLFHVIEPAEGEAEGIVRVLHLYHGAKRTEPVGEPETPSS